MLSIWRRLHFLSLDEELTLSLSDDDTRSFCVRCRSRSDCAERAV